MGKLIYTGITSLDGYIADRDGKFDWGMPDEEVHRFINALERPIGTYLYGRRLYEVMVSWESLPLAGEGAAERDYAQLWRAAEKVVYSTTLEAPSSARTRIERDFDPEQVRQLKSSAEQDISIGGPVLASHAIRAGLVDEFGLFVSPVLVGGGKPFFPDDVRLQLELLDERRFGNGVLYLRYGAMQ